MRTDTNTGRLRVLIWFTGAVNGNDLRMCSGKNKGTGTVMGTSTNMLTGTGTSADMGMVTG